MKQALADYYRETEEKAEAFARQDQTTSRFDHLQAFNLGRMVQRIEYSRRDAWLRVGLLLAGLAIGVAVGRISPAHIYDTLNKAMVFSSPMGPP